MKNFFSSTFDYVNFLYQNKGESIFVEFAKKYIDKSLFLTKHEITVKNGSMNIALVFKNQLRLDFENFSCNVNDEKLDAQNLNIRWFSFIYDSLTKIDKNLAKRFFDDFIEFKRLQIEKEAAKAKLLNKGENHEKL